MKNKKIKNLIQKPLRFHHQDIHDELDEIKETLRDVTSTLQEMRKRIDEYDKNTKLWMSKYDENYGRQNIGS